MAKCTLCVGYNGASVSRAEVYDPSSGSLGSWTVAGSLNTTRHFHTATLLPSGKVLVTGGSNGSGYSVALADAEVCDPSLDTWTTLAPLSTAWYGHTATLLLNGKVLVAGGSNSGNTGNLNSAELYNRGLGFVNDWRPAISAIPSELINDKPLSFTGTGFRGYNLQKARMVEPIILPPTIHSFRSVAWIMNNGYG